MTQMLPRQALLRQSRLLRFVILPLTLIPFLPACYKHTPVETGMDAAEEFRPVRVTMINGERIFLDEATVDADSIRGMRERRSESSPIRRMSRDSGPSRASGERLSRAPRVRAPVRIPVPDW